MLQTAGLMRGFAPESLLARQMPVPEGVVHLPRCKRRIKPPRTKCMSEGAVEIKDLVKTYVDDRGRATFTAVKNISLHVENGEFMVLVGPSGCGKSTTLRMIAGLEKITSGTISIGSRVVNELEPKDRGIAMVFQNYALYPHMTIFNNNGVRPSIGKRTEGGIQCAGYFDR